MIIYSPSEGCIRNILIVRTLWNQICSRCYSACLLKPMLKNAFAWILSGDTVCVYDKMLPKRLYRDITDVDMPRIVGFNNIWECLQAAVSVALSAREVDWNSKVNNIFAGYLDLTKSWRCHPRRRNKLHVEVSTSQAFPKLNRLVFLDTLVQ